MKLQLIPGAIAELNILASGAAPKITDLNIINSIFYKAIQSATHLDANLEGLTPQGCYLLELLPNHLFLA